MVPLRRFQQHEESVAWLIWKFHFVDEFNFEQESREHCDNIYAAERRVYV